MLEEGIHPKLMVSNWYSKDAYLKSYVSSLQPIKGRIFWPQTENIPPQSPEE